MADPMHAKVITFWGEAEAIVADAQAKLIIFAPGVA